MAPSINWRARRPATTTYANRLSGGCVETVIVLTASKSIENLSHSLVAVVAAAARGQDDGTKIVAGPVEVIVDHDKIVLGPAGHFLPGPLQPPPDGFLGILAAGAQSLLDGLARGRHDEHSHGVGNLLLDLRPRPARQSRGPGSALPAAPRPPTCAACRTSACQTPGRTPGTRRRPLASGIPPR